MASSSQEARAQLDESSALIEVQVGALRRMSLGVDTTECSNGLVTGHALHTQTRQSVRIFAHRAARASDKEERTFDLGELFTHLSL